VTFAGGATIGKILFDGTGQATRTSPVFKSGASCVLSMFSVAFRNIVTEARTLAPHSFPVYLRVLRLPRASLPCVILHRLASHPCPIAVVR
jgi:hypothetical protein